MTATGGQYYTEFHLITFVSLTWRAMKAQASRDLRVLFLLLSSFVQLYATFGLIQHPKPVKIRNKLKRCFQGYHQLGK